MKDNVSSFTEDADLRTVEVSKKKLQSRKKNGKRKILRLLGNVYITKKACPNSPTVIFPRSTEVSKYRHGERKFIGGCSYGTWLLPNE